MIPYPHKDYYWNSEFESRSGEVYSIQHYVIQFVSDLRQGLLTCVLLLFLTSETQVIELVDMMVQGYVVSY
jgi:hypothetical protein